MHALLLLLLLCTLGLRSNRPLTTPHLAPPTCLPQLWCTWARAIRRPCLEGRRGVLPLELYHLMEQYRLIMPYDPSSEKYLDLPGEAQCRRRNS